MDLKSTYNKIAEDWFKDHEPDTWWQDGVDKFLTPISKDASLLDIGCGAGQKTRYVHNKGYHIMGGDFSEKMVQIAQRQAPDINFEVIDIYEIDQYLQTFDAILAQAVLLHIPKARVVEVMTKLATRLNKDGLLYVAVKASNDGIEEKVETENDYGYEYSRFFSYYTSEELERYFKEAGFELVWSQSAHSGRTEWLQVVGRKVA